MAQPALDAFNNFMNGSTALPAYDYAIGLVKYELIVFNTKTFIQENNNSIFFLLKLKAKTFGPRHLARHR